MDRQEGLAVTLTAIVVLSAVVAGIGAVPALTAAASSNDVVVSGTLEYADGTFAKQRKVSLKNDRGTFVHELTNDSGGFSLSVPENETLNLVFEQFNSTSGVDFPRDGNPDLYAVRTVDTGTANRSLGGLSLPNAHVLNVTVVDSTGKPVPDARITLRHHNDGAVATNDAYTNGDGNLVLNGTNRLGVELNGTVEVNVRGPSGYGKNVTTYTVTQDRHVEIVLPKTATLNGSVSDADDAPATGDTLVFDGPASYAEARTGSDGNFSATVTANDTYTVRYYQDGVNAPAPDDDLPDFYALGTLTPPPGTTDLGDRSLPVARNLTVRVERADGSAVENATVRVHQHANGETAHAKRTTGSSGAVRLDVTDAETGISVTPPASTDLGGNGTHFALTGDTTKTIVLRPVVNVSGRVTNPSGNAVSGWRVEGHPDDEPGASNGEQTDADGRYTLQLSENTSYEIGFEQANFDRKNQFPKDGVVDLDPIRNYQTNAGDDDIGTHRLPRAHHFNVTVLLPDGSVATDVTGHVSVFEPSTDLEVSSEFRTNANGKLVLDGATAPGVEVNGSLRVHVRAPDGASYAGTTEEFRVKSDGQNATIRLEPALDVTGTILQPDGQTPASEERIEVDSVGESGGSGTHTDENGTFSATVAAGSDYHVGFTQVAGPDSYQASFERDGVPDVYAITTVENESEASLGAVTLPDPHNLTVRVVDEHGNNVSDAQVNLGSRANGARHWARGVTNANGTLTAEVVGPLSVHVQPPTDRLTSNGTQVTVDGDQTVRVVLREATVINGTVTNSTGGAAENVRVQFHTDTSGNSDVTNATGHYSVAVQESDWYHVDLTQEGLPGESFPDDGVPGAYATPQRTNNATPQDFRLPYGHDLAVTVTDGNGTAIANADVRVAHQNGDFQAGIDGTTDANGRFVPEGANDPGVEMNGTVRIHVRPPADSPFKEATRRVTVNRSRQVTVTLSRGVRVTGFAEYANGDPVDGYTMELQGDGGDNRVTHDGYFDLRVEPNRTYKLGFKQTDWGDGKTDFPKDGRPDLHMFRTYEVGSTSQRVGNLTLPKAHLVNVTVVNANGDTVSGLSVDVHSVADGRRFHHGGHTNEHGEVVLDGANAPGVEVNGTLHVHTDPTGKYASNSTEFRISDRRNVTVVVKQRVNVTGQFVDETGEPLAEGSTVGALTFDDFFEFRETNATGNFTLPVAANQSYSIGVIQNDPDTDQIAPRDNVTDIYAAANVQAGTSDVSLGRQTVPNASGILNVRVVDETGSPVEDARVTVFGNQSGDIPGVGWVTPTDSDGYYVVAGRHGVEATGDNAIRVRPPSGSEKYVDETYWRNVTVTENRTVTVTIENANPVVTGQYVDAFGDPVRNGSGFAFNFSRDFVTDVSLDANGEFATTTPNGTFTFGVANLTTGDGTVDAWSVTRDVAGDTSLGTIDLPRGYNVTLNATENGAQADTVIGVRGGNDHWIYEYGTGRKLDSTFNDRSHVQTRELANGTHNVTVRDAWTHDVLNESVVTVDGADESVTYAVDQFADLDLSGAEGLTVVRDLQSPAPTHDSPEALIRDGVNVRLNVLNHSGESVVIEDTLPAGYRINETYNVQYDGSGTVTPRYYRENRTLVLNVTGDVEDIRYRAEPKPDAEIGNAATWDGTFREAGTTTSGRIVGQSAIYGDEYRLSGTLVNADGNASAGTTLVYGTPTDRFHAAAVTGDAGGFAVSLPAATPVDVRVFQGNYTQADAPAVPNRDGTVDIYAAGELTRVENLDLGTTGLPAGHVVNVTVVNQNQEPVANASVTVTHTGANETQAELTVPVDANGYLHLNNTSRPGVELNGSVEFAVNPPAGYTIDDANKSRSINDSTGLTFVLNSTDGGDGGDGGTSTASVGVVDTSVSARTVDAGDTVSVDVTLENTGDASGTVTVDLTANGSVVASTDVTVAANSQKTVTLSTTFPSTGDKALGVTAAGESVSAGTVTVTEPAPANVTVANASLSATEIATGDSVLVNATLVNTGDREGNVTVAFLKNGDVFAQKTYSVAGNAERTVSVERTFTQNGTYDVAVRNASTTDTVVAGTLTVSEQQTTTADTPGFGVAPALVALLGAALVLIRRRR